MLNTLQPYGDLEDYRVTVAPDHRNVEERGNNKKLITKK